MKIRCRHGWHSGDAEAAVVHAEFGHKMKIVLFTAPLAIPNMISPDVLQSINKAIRRHVQSKGDADSPWQNPLVPQDCVAAFAMAKLLTQKQFDHYLAVAPEGHVYGFFFERLGARVLSVFVDYPPRRLESRDDLTVIQGGRVLILEDDVISGVTLQLVPIPLEYAGTP